MGSSPHTFPSVVRELRAGLKKGTANLGAEPLARDNGIRSGKELDGRPGVPRFVFLLIPKRNREHLIGDLEEEYRSVVLPEYGPFWARLWYWEQTVLAVGAYLWVGIKRVLGGAAVRAWRRR